MEKASERYDKNAGKKESRLKLPTKMMRRGKRNILPERNILHLDVMQPTAQENI